MSDLPETWTTKDGRHIPIRKMSVQHIRNSLRMLRRDGNLAPVEYKEQLATLFSASPNGEMACDALDDASFDLAGQGVSHFIPAFEAELRRRGETP